MENLFYEPPVKTELSKFISPAADLIVFEHNPYNPVTRRIVNNCPYDADAVLLKPRELRQLLTAGGFQVLAQGYCLFIPPAFKSLLWLEPRLEWLPLGGQHWVRAQRPTVSNLQ